MRQPPISVVINTLDADRYLDLAIRSVTSWAAEVVVADMGSSDNTTAIAHDLGARVIDIPNAGFVEPGRAAAVEEAMGDWILILDADEVVPDELAQELTTFANTGRFDAVMVHRLNYLLGQPTDHSGWEVEADRHLRFHRRGAVTYPTTIHTPSAPLPGTTWTRATTPLVHFNYAGVDDFLRRLDRYTTVEAATRFAAGERASLRSGIRGGALEFLRRFVRGRGYRHGWRGLSLAVMMSLYRFTIEAKLAQLHEVGTSDDVVELYRRLAVGLFEGDDGA